MKMTPMWPQPLSPARAMLGTATLLALAALFGAGTLRASTQQPEPRVSLASGAGIADVVGELARATNGVVVADAAVEERVLRQTLTNATIGEAVTAISVDLDRYWVRRGRSLALQLRFSDPEEPPAVELAELRLVGGDLLRLLSILPNIDTYVHRGNQADVLESITPEQQERMRAGGLPFGELSTEQQRLVTQLALAASYKDAKRELRRVALALAGPHAVTLSANRSGDSRYVLFKFPDTDHRDGRDGLSMRVVDELLANKSSARRPEGEELSGRAIEGTSWRTGPRLMTLAEFSGEWRRVHNSPLRIPDYAAGRRFWICSEGPSRAQAASALADLWGWEFGDSGDGHRLGRPTFGPPANVSELHDAMKRVIPPAIGHQYRNTATYRDMRRRMRQLQLALRDVDELGGPDWMSLALTRVGEEAQQRLGCEALAQQISRWYGPSPAMRLSTGPPEYVSAPGTIKLILDGPLSATPPPMFWISAPARDGKATRAWGFPADLEGYRRSARPPSARPPD